MKEKQDHTQTHTHGVEQHVRSKQSTPAASQNYCWLSGTLPQPVTGDCSISSLWRSGQLSERETSSLGNSSSSISPLRGTGRAISEWDASGFKDVYTANTVYNENKVNIKAVKDRWIRREEGASGLLWNLKWSNGALCRAEAATQQNHEKHYLK